MADTRFNIMAKSLYERMRDEPFEDRQKVSKAIDKSYGSELEIYQKKSRRKRPQVTSKKSSRSAHAPAVNSGTSSPVASVKIPHVRRKDDRKSFMIPGTSKKTVKRKRISRKKSKSSMSRLGILVKLKLLRVLKFRTDSFSRRFIEKLEGQYAEALRILQMQLEIIEEKMKSLEILMVRLGCRDNAIMQALIDLMQLYDSDMFEGIIEKYYDNPGKHISAWEKEFVPLYSDMYAVYFYRDEVCDLIREMVKYVSVYSEVNQGTKNISVKDVDVYFKTIFDVFFIKLHWLFCFYAGIKIQPDDPDLLRLIGTVIAGMQKPEKKRRIVKNPEDIQPEPVNNTRISEEQTSAIESTPEEVPDNLDDIEGINPAVAKPVADKSSGAQESAVNNHAGVNIPDVYSDTGVSYFITCYNTPSALMEKSTGLDNINHRCDKVLLLSYIFKKYVEQFSFFFITNKIKYTSHEVEFIMHGYYNEITRLENDIKNYFMLVELYYNTVNKEAVLKNKNYVSSAGRIDSIERQRQNSGGILRNNVQKYLIRINGTLSRLINETGGGGKIILNSDSVIKFDGKIEKEKIVNNSTILQTMLIISAFNNYFINELDPSGSLGGVIALRNDLIPMNDPVFELAEKERIHKKNESEREKMRLDEQKRIEDQQREKLRLDLERAEAEQREQERLQRETIEEKKAEAERLKIEEERNARERARLEKEEFEKSRQKETELFRQFHEKLGKEMLRDKSDTGEAKASGYGDVRNSGPRAKMESFPPGINHEELWEKAVREKIVFPDRAVNEYIELGSSLSRETIIQGGVKNGVLRPVDGRNSAYAERFKPYINYRYNDVVRRVMEFEINLTDFIRSVLMSKYGERWQSIIARSNEKIRTKLERENELIRHRGIEYDILEVCSIGQKFNNIIMNDLLWADFKTALGIDKTDRSAKTVFQKRATQIISLRNDMMHLKTVDNIKMEIGLGAVSELTDYMKKYSFHRPISPYRSGNTGESVLPE